MPDLVFHFLGVNLRSSLSTDALAKMCAQGSVRGYPSPLLTMGMSLALPAPSLHPFLSTSQI